MDGAAVVPWVLGCSCSVRAVGSSEVLSCGSFGDGTLRTELESTGLYEVSVSPPPGYRRPEPVLVVVDDPAPPPVLIQLERE